MTSTEPTAADSILFSSYGAGSGKRDKHDSTGSLRQTSATPAAAAERPKTVQVFQKGYYLEPIRGEAVRVPSWRMKEKVSSLDVEKNSGGFF